MVKTKTYLLLGLVVLVALLPFLGLAWLGFSYLRYAPITQQACQGYDWWEDEAECAAQFALEKNDPRYCRINMFGEISDICSLIYAKQTTDPATCKKIDLWEAKDKCSQRFKP